MKYEFCGKLDCPDWILAQLFYASQLPLDKFEMICTSVKENLLDSEQTAFDEGKFLASLGFDSERYKKSGCDFDIDDARACFAAVHYITTSTCLYGVPAKQLAIELEQLGLASEHSRIICALLNSGHDNDEDDDDRRHLNMQVHMKLTHGLAETRAHSDGC